MARKQKLTVVHCRFAAPALTVSFEISPAEEQTVRIAALIVAAGRGARAAQAGDAAPKQYALLGGASLLSRSVKAFQAAPEITDIQIVIHPDDRALYETSVPAGASKLLEPALGGETRQASVRLGLIALEEKIQPDRVLIHDAARPFVDGDMIARVSRGLRFAPGALPALQVSDTIKRLRSDSSTR